MSSSTERRNERLREILELTMDLPAAGRGTAVDELCGSDADLRAEVCSLLNAVDTAGHLLEPGSVPAPRPAAPLTGMTIGPYVVCERLGAGGMGIVYRARDTRLDRTVAVKALPEFLAKDPQRRALLEREARTLAALSHPNIAAILAIEDSPAGPVLVLEHVPGQTLLEMIKGGPLPPEEARPIARQILLALEAAHEAGVVHRDIKPGNVMVTPEGVVKVLDFGIARLAPHAMVAQDGPETIAMAGRGSFLGTAAYMSPEQARGKPLDRRTDLWAFGCVLYEVLSGYAAFPGETTSDTIASVLRAEPDWTRVRASTPSGVLRVLRRCLEKDVDRRLRDAGDARVELDEAWETPPPAQAGSKRRVIGGAACLLVAVAAGAAAMLWLRPPPAAHPRTPTRFTIPVPPQRPLRTDVYSGCVAVSPDGRCIVYSAGPVNDPGPQLYRQNLGDFAGSPIPGTERGVAPFFSPDGRWVGFLELRPSGPGILKRVLVEGGTAQTIATPFNGSSHGACWTEDNFIIFSDPEGIKKVPAGGGEVTDVCRLMAPMVETLAYPLALPGGRVLLMSCGYAVGDGYSSRIEALSMDSGERRTIVDEASCAQIVAGSDLLVYRQGASLLAARFSPSTLSLRGDPVPITPSPLHTTNVQFSISAGGTLAYALGSTMDYGEELAWYYPDGRIEPMYRAQSAIRTLRLSPDGRQIAFTTRPPNPGLWVLDIERGTTLRLIDVDDVGFPVWHPAGGRLAVSLGYKGSNAIAMTAADGSSAPEIVYSDPNGRKCFPTDFSPGAAELLISMDTPDGAATDIFALTVPGPPGDGAVLRTLFRTPADRVAGRFSPDGKFIAYASTETGRSEIYVQDYPALARKVLVSTNGGSRPMWSSDGTRVFFQNHDKLESVRILAEPELRANELSGVLSYLPFGRYDAVPDGSRFVMARAGGDWRAPNSVFVVLNADAEVRGQAEKAR
jgi:hypothetical protein